MTKPEPLTEGQFYHVYNRETLFHTAENYRYFMQQYVHHIEPVAVTYAYCLLPNHFHLLVYVRTVEDQKRWLFSQGCQLSENWQPSPSHHAFKNLFIGYAMAFNRRYERTGSLFQKPFKRKRVDSDRYFAALVRYIHRNPRSMAW